MAQIEALARLIELRQDLEALHSQFRDCWSGQTEVIRREAAAALAFALLMGMAAHASADTVLPVGDGDTIRVIDGAKRITIRLACIDAPETAQSPNGAASTVKRKSLLPIGSTPSRSAVTPSTNMEGLLLR